MGELHSSMYLDQGGPYCSGWFMEVAMYNCGLNWWSDRIDCVISVLSLLNKEKTVREYLGQQGGYRRLPMHRTGIGWVVHWVVRVGRKKI